MTTVKRWTGICASLMLIASTVAARDASQRGSQSPAPLALSGAHVCGNQPFCAEELSFAAAITDFQAILQNTNSKTLTVRVKVHNKLNRPLILGYVSGSGIATDERGNRYTVSGERAVQGIGVIQGNSGDPKFLLQVNETSDARFEFVWNSSGQEIFGIAFQIDLAIREIDPLPGGQTRLGREHALHFSGLGNRSSTAPKTTEAPPPAVAPAAAAAAPVPLIDPCVGRSLCYSAAGVFVAEVTGMAPLSSLNYNPPVDVLQARVRFRNLTREPLVLGYVADSAVFTDDFGSRYDSRESMGHGEGARGMGVVRGNQADSQFVLGPGASSEATFMATHGRRRGDRLADTFRLDFTIARLEILPSRQVRTVREYSVGFTNVSTAGGTAARPVGTADDGCTGKPQCYSAGPFTAEVTGLSSSSLNYNPPIDVLQARVRFRNLTSRPIILGYVSGSALVIDNSGNRYSSNNPTHGEGAKGIGLVTGRDADPQFVLNPGASADATFSVSHGRGRNDQPARSFNFEVTIAHLEALDSRQIHTIRDYAVGITNLTASGQGILNKLIKPQDPEP